MKISWSRKDRVVYNQPYRDLAPSRLSTLVEVGGELQVRALVPSNTLGRWLTSFLWEYTLAYN